MKGFWVIGLVVGLAGCGGQTPPTLAHGKPVSDWVQALQDPTVKVRQKAVSILGNVGVADPAAIPALIGAVKDRDPEVRAAAIRALQKIGPAAREAVPVLEQVRKDPNSKVRTYAAQALEVIQGNP